MKEIGPESYAAQLLVKRLAVLFWREHRLAAAEVREFRLSEYDVMRVDAAGEEAAEQTKQLILRENTKATRDEVETKSREAYKKARLETARLSELVIPLERQLLIGRYQTMLSNQIAQTYRQLEAEMERNMRILEAEPRYDPANDTSEVSPDAAGEHPAKK
ncbi:MAG: hypothetical protein AAGJ51_09275 [Pseudomonadota bacterium]